jgi:perosamine synthetase
VGFSWHDFRDRYRAMGGDGVYAAWRLTHAEPAFRGARFGDWQSQDYQPGLCPVAEALQPRLFQFKTNYFDLDRARRAADALRKTIRDFGS